MTRKHKKVEIFINNLFFQLGMTLSKAFLRDYISWHQDPVYKTVQT